ncbi:MAG: hypothetical protein LC102_12685 [Ignavibacteriales bacterium]|jgi:hypothetical protein|nr:MAG: hypothetical protein F9K26_00460 [Ignavibacteriaceae bacterium]MBW7871882.1 hypothetical protein [Ignavibacteria bacterium]MCZ2144268.1 hypothetical protein [Ignavibacteriales bacterium]OQY69632.1 MAG: hypothetical protein B6D45_12560 [Ignavibacteriales bacterium UTCHB3]MBV6446221.1 hypothetical protein [Ignavibacteriaceae bacterium]
MKKIFIVVLLLTTGVLAQGKWAAGAGGSFLVPMGELENRFSPGYGASLFATNEVSEKWAWSGKVEFLTFNKLNEDKMNIKREYLIGTEQKTFTYPIKSLEMDLKAYGVAVQADYFIVKNQMFETKLNLGFGIYNWQFKRGSYKDSLYVNDTTGAQMLQELLDVPRLDQEDWSGTINAGVEFGIKVFDPVWFSVSANYKNMLGELWSTLKLDFENVASMQMIELKATVRAKF